MKLFIIIFLFINLLYNSHAGEINWTLSGTDSFSTVKIKENHFVMKYEMAAGQFETDTSLFGFMTCFGTVEMKNDKMSQTIFCTITDSYGHKGYTKSVPATKKKLSGNMLGDRVGSSIGSWEFIGGEGPFIELIGTTMTGAYFQMGNNDSGLGNFVWKGKADGLSDSVISRINNYTKKE